MTDAHAALRAVVRGEVQGVGFRFFVQRQALQLGLSGWVRNRPDGSVEVAAEGPRPSLESLLPQLQLGPRFAIVEEVEVSWAKESTGLVGFEIRP